MLLLAFAVACSPSDLPGSPIVQLEPGTAAEAGVYPAPPSAGGAVVRINEIQAKNRSTWQDSSWEFPDWIELYNSGDEGIDCNDISLTDLSGETWRGPDGDRLEPGEHLFLVANEGDGDYDLPFALGSDAEDVVTLAVQGSRVDVVPVGDLDSDMALARYPDGGAWLPTARPTPGWTNGSAPPDSLDPADELFRPYVMHQLDLVIDPGLFGSLDSRNEEPGQATMDGIYFRKVGIKNTGQGSYDPMTGKPRLVINLDAYDTDREFRGVDNLELHNGKTADQTRARDWVTYRYAALAGLPSSRVGFTQVTINGEDYGLYVLVEDPDDKWIEKRFPASAETGILFEEGEYGTGSSVSSFDYEVGPEPADPASTAAMEAADDIAGGPATDEAVEKLWEYVEHDGLLNYLAWEGISNHWDGYNSPHNWRIYVDGVTHRTWWVPAGVEITWQGPPDLWGSNGNLSGWCIDNAGCKRDYAEHILVMADLADDSHLADDFADVFGWLEPYIKDDPKKFEDMGVVTGVYNNSLGYLRTNPEDARKDVYADFPDLKP